MRSTRFCLPLSTTTIAIGMTFLFALTVLTVNPVHAARPAKGTSIAIPAMGIDTEIFWMDITPQNGEPVWYIAPWETRVGHLEQTAWLGEGSNIVIGAHANMPDGSWGIFGFLPYLQIGEQIIIREDGVEYTFVVQETLIVSYTDVSVVEVDEDRLTLITCSAVFDPALADYPYRHVVIALPVH